MATARVLVFDTSGAATPPRDKHTRWRLRRPATSTRAATETTAKINKAPVKRRKYFYGKRSDNGTNLPFAQAKGSK